MKTIPLSRGLVAIVSDRDHKSLSRFKWSATLISGIYYAVRTDRANMVYMHRQILGLCDHNLQSDHKDLDGLNNQRSNLRVATRSLNGANRRKRPGLTSRFKGVSLQKVTGKWIAQISDRLGKINGRPLRYLGTFENEQDAADAYVKAAKIVHGEFARFD